MRRRPDDRALQARLGFLLLTDDAFHESAEWLRPLADLAPSFGVLHSLALALISQVTPASDAEAIIAARRAADLATDDHDRANALALMGKAFVRQGHRDTARTLFEEALAIAPANKDAYKRLAMLDFEAGRTVEALEHANQLTASGVAHARVLGVRALAYAKLGHIDEAWRALGIETFLHRCTPEPPDGWNSAGEFNIDLCAELLTHPGTRFERYGTASEKSWRIDEPRMTGSRLVPVLQSLIRREVLAFVHSLPAAGHPFVAGRPARATLRNWCVITESDGFEEWHVHQNGWLSGVYYVEIPDFIAQGTGRAGCIAFGMPPDIIGADRAAEMGLREVRPHTGLMMLFPSHAFHRTFPHGGGHHRRVCFAFDIVPEPSRRGQ